MPRAKVVPGVTVESDSEWDANRFLNPDQKQVYRSMVQETRRLQAPRRPDAPGQLVVGPGHPEGDPLVRVSIPPR